MMRPYSDGYLPVSRAADAIRNQAETILNELHGSINRAQEFRAKMAARAKEKAHRAELLTRINQMNDDLWAEQVARRDDTADAFAYVSVTPGNVRSPKASWPQVTPLQGLMSLDEWAQLFGGRR